MGWVSCSPGAARSADRHRLGLFLLQVDFADHLVHDPVRLRLLRRHEEIPVGVLLDLRKRLTGVADNGLIHRVTLAQEFLLADFGAPRIFKKKNATPTCAPLRWPLS